MFFYNELIRNNDIFMSGVHFVKSRSFASTKKEKL